MRGALGECEALGLEVEEGGAWEGEVVALASAGEAVGRAEGVAVRRAEALPPPPTAARE